MPEQPEIIPPGAAFTMPPDADDGIDGAGRRRGNTHDRRAPRFTVVRTLNSLRKSSLDNPIGFALLCTGLGLSMTSLGISGGWLTLSEFVLILGLGMLLIGYAAYAAKPYAESTESSRGHFDPRFERLAGRLEAGLESLKDLQWEVRDSQARYLDLLDNQSDVILRRDHNGRLTFVNDAFCRTFSTTHSEIIGSRYAPDVLDGDSPPSFPESIGEHRRHYVNRIDTVNGPRWFSWNDYAVVDENSRLTEMQSVGRDITEQRESETRLQEARDIAEAANQAKSRFLATMSHEIRTPMNGIKGMTDLLFDTELSAEQSSYARTIQGSARTLLTLIDEVLDFSRIEAGKLKLESGPVDLAETVQGIVELLAPRVSEKGLEMGYFIDPDLPVTILGDETRLRQILLNLTGNAIKFTEKGGLTFDLRKVAAPPREAALGPAHAHKLQITITDTGIGMAPEVHESIFAEFEQVDQGLARRTGGTGLGLAITKRLVQEMGGQISVESTPGRGSAFTVALPLHTSAPNVPTLAANWPELPEDSRILVACKAGLVGKTLVETLQARGAECVECAPEDALSRVRKNVKAGQPFSAILTDRIHSLSFIETLKGAAQPGNTSDQVKIVVLIEPGDRGKLERLRKHGMTSYLIRPVRPVSLLTHVGCGEPGQMASGKDGRYSKDEQTGKKEPGAARNAAPARTKAGKHRKSSKSAAKPSQWKVSSAPEHPDLETPPSKPDGEAAGIRVLLVEDNEVNMLLARKSLEIAGCEVTHAADGLEAVDFVSKRLDGRSTRPFDLIFMDIHMPKMDGFEATKAIRAKLAEHGLRPTLVPIIALTANAFSESRAQCLAAGLDDYLAKPFEREALTNILHKWALR